MRVLLVLNDPLYGTERSNNGLRLITAGSVEDRREPPPVALPQRVLVPDGRVRQAKKPGGATEPAR
jgi:hypothetical protein